MSLRVAKISPNLGLDLNRSVLIAAPGIMNNLMQFNLLVLKNNVSTIHRILSVSERRNLTVLQKNLEDISNRDRETNDKLLP